jgi:hypothetical protein
MRNTRAVRRLTGATFGEWNVIKSSEFSTIAVLVAATAAVVAVQQHRERERRLPAPPAIEAEPLAPSTDARLASPTGVDLAVTSPAGAQPAGGP